MDAFETTWSREMGKPRIPMLQAANYGEWSERAESALVIKDLDSAIDFTGRCKGTLELPANATQEAKALAIRKDKKALAFMKLHVSNSFLPVLREVASANEAWHKLKDTNASSCKARQVFLRQELSRLRKEDGEQITQYVARDMGMRNDLMAAGYPKMGDYELSLAILQGLPLEYAIIVSIVESRLQDSSTIDEVLQQLLTAEERVKSITAQEAHRNLHVADAFMVRHKQQDARSCWRCGKSGHVKANCPGRKKEEYAGLAIADLVF